MTNPLPSSARPHSEPPRRRPARVAAVQMVLTPRVADNLATAARLVADAVRDGAELVVLPEYFAIIGLSNGDKLRVREEDGSGPIRTFSPRRRHATASG